MLVKRLERIVRKIKFKIILETFEVRFEHYGGFYGNKDLRKLNDIHESSLISKMTDVI